MAGSTAKETIRSSSAASFPLSEADFHSRRYGKYEFSTFSVAHCLGQSAVEYHSHFPGSLGRRFLAKSSPVFLEIIPGAAKIVLLIFLFTGLLLFLRKTMGKKTFRLTLSSQASFTCRIYSGVVPQHPPTIFAPISVMRFICPANSSAPMEYTGTAVFIYHRHTGIGFHNQWNLHSFSHIFYHGKQLIRSGRTVDSHSSGSHFLQGLHCFINISAEKQTAVRFHGQRAHNRKFPCRLHPAQP